MTKRKLMDYLLAKPGSEAGYPFGPGTLVFKVGGKMFALLGEDSRPWTINLKCDPDDALALRAAYPTPWPTIPCHSERTLSRVIRIAD